MKPTLIDLAIILRILVFPGFAFLLTLALFCDWFERKLLARMQNRMGPTYTGPAGILQPLADYIKLLTKEDVTPGQAGRFLFTLSPMLAFSLFLFSLFYLPMDGSNVFLGPGFEGDLIFVLALVTIAYFALFLSGWSSVNPYSGIGAARVLTQFLGYDMPLILLALGPALLARSLCVATIAAKQTVPFAILIPWVFMPFLLTLQAELEKDPFDTPHAETEIVAGYGTEFGGRKLAFVRFSKDLQLVFGAALTVELFLGGPYGPVPFGPEAAWYTLWFVAKTLSVIFLLEYVGAVCARLRIDQVVWLNWRMMVPTAILSLILTVICAPWFQSFIG